MARVRQMGTREVGNWARFEEDFGPLTLHERIDALIAAHTGEMPRWESTRSAGSAVDFLSAIARKH